MRLSHCKTSLKCEAIFARKLSLTIRAVYNLLQHFISRLPGAGRGLFPHGERGDLLKLIVSKIPEGGINLGFEKDGEWFRGLLPEPATCDSVPERIAVSCSVRRMNETVFIQGNVSATLDMRCCRCLEPVRLPVEAPFKYTFAPLPSQLREECELSADDLEFAYYQEDTIDLEMVVFEQVVLQIPIKPLCADSCRGLCPRCGINLNTASCGCEAERFDERLAALKKYKIQTESKKEEL